MFSTKGGTELTFGLFIPNSSAGIVLESGCRHSSFTRCPLVIPRNTRAMAQMVEGLLSGSFLPQFQSQISRVIGKEKISERDVREAFDKESLQPQLSELSKREREILSLMAQGKSNAGIAKALYITEGSVEKHISSILLKPGLPVEEENHRRVLAVLKYLGIEKPT